MVFQKESHAILFFLLLIVKMIKKASNFFEKTMDFFGKV